MQISVVQSKLYDIRGFKVMLDFDLAEMYGVETRRLKEAVRRNLSRFPPDFMFQLKKEEYNSLRSQFATLEKGKGRGKHSKYLPYAFTEQGVAMLSSVLNSEKAIQVNIIIMRTFILVRQYALDYIDLQNKITKLEKKYKKDFQGIIKALEHFLQEKASEEDFKNRQRIGFKN
jgi:hypothetical protein